VNYNLLADGKLDIDYDFYATGSAGLVRTTEALGTPNAVAAQAPTVQYAAPINLGFYKKFNRFFVNGSANATKYWYEDYSVITSQGLPAASRERTEYNESLRFGYELTEDFAVFVAPSLSQIRYLQTVDAVGQNRNADGANAGVAPSEVERYQHSRRLAGVHPTEQSVGPRQYRSLYVWPRRHLDGYAPLTLRPNISRSINQSHCPTIRHTSRRSSGRLQLHHPRCVDDGWRRLL